MSATSTLFGPRMRSASPAWARLFVEMLDADVGSINVEWLSLDEVIVLESEPELV